MLYTPVKLTVAKDQLEKLKSSLNKPFMSIKIRIIKPLSSSYDAAPQQQQQQQHTLLLTRAQIASIEKVRANGHRRFKTIRMSKQQVKKNIAHEGGFLGFLAGLASKVLPLLAKGLATGLISGAAHKMINGGDGLYLFKRGHCIKVDPVKGNGLYLRSHHSGNGMKGDGLFLKRGGSMQTVGEGLILGKNSPFKNIPVLGWIL